MKAKPTTDDINALLPQTQCQLGEFSGCKPYAEAIASGEALIDRCLPGGIPTLKALASITNQSSEPYELAMHAKAKPDSTVLIHEEACIGCTKCIKVCPVDAIIGSSKQMHSIIPSLCTGCDLCIPACPTDCIESQVITPRDEEASYTLARQSQQRYERKLARQHKKEQLVTSPSKPNDIIAAALAREKERKGS